MPYGTVRRAPGERRTRLGGGVAWLSRTITLLPGDIIATGTPAGVGAAQGPGHLDWLLSFASSRT